MNTLVKTVTNPNQDCTGARNTARWECRQQNMYGRKYAQWLGVDGLPKASPFYQSLRDCVIYQHWRTVILPEVRP